MADVPWFMLSPSPVSLIQYAVLTWFGSRFLMKRVKYDHPRIMSLVQALLVVGFFVLITDCFWAGFCALKFIPMFPQDTVQILSSFARDVLAAHLCFMLIGGYFINGVLSFDLIVKSGIFLSFQAQALWFLMAPSPAYTDYTFAWRHGYSLDFVVAAWFLSHFIMRLPLWMSIIAAFKNGRKPKEMEEPES